MLCIYPEYSHMCCMDIDILHMLYMSRLFTYVLYGTRYITRVVYVQIILHIYLTRKVLHEHLTDL